MHTGFLMNRRHIPAMVFSLLILLAPLQSGADDGVRQTTEGRIPLNEREQTAVAASFSGTVVTRNFGRMSVEAVPGRSDSNECIPVEVVSVTPYWKEINRYRICNGLIASDEYNPVELEPAEKESEPNFDLFITELAKKAGQHGMAQGIFKNYTLKATALKREDSCSVEVNIFEGKTRVKTVIQPCE